MNKINNERLTILIDLRKTYKNDIQNTIFNTYNEFLNFLYDEVFYYNGLTLEEVKKVIR